MAQKNADLDLKEQLARAREPFSLSAFLGKKSVKPAELNLKKRRALRGHFGKVFSLDWVNENQIVSASQDGRLIVWNARTTNKLGICSLRSSWVMTCAASPNGKFVASGGLDNACTIHELKMGLIERATSELVHHEGYVSGIEWVNNDSLLSASGDSTIALWDCERREVTTSFTGHQVDVMAISLLGKKGQARPNIFISGSCDATAKMWDGRTGNNPVMTFYGHESDLNKVKVCPDDNSFVTASDDGTVRLFDLRAQKEMNCYHSPHLVSGALVVDTSATGRYIFAGYDDSQLICWDALHAKPVCELQNGDMRVSALATSPDGKALATGAWCSNIFIWA